VLHNDLQRDVLPPPSRLRDALDRLWARGRSRDVVELVEAWALVDEPDAHARLRQAQALDDLGQMERAWTRLKPLVEAPNPPLDVLEAVAAHYLRRGWNSRARELIGRALADHPRHAGLQAAWERASRPPPPPPSAPSAQGALTLGEHLPIAEDFLASGQVLSGRTLLERLARQYPDDERVRDLLWALRGDYTASGAPVGEIVERVLPDDLPGSDRFDDEHTDSVTEERGDDDRASASRATFPSLFRSPAGPDADAEESTDEITAARELGFVSMPDDFEERPTEIDDAGDTRIQRVIDLHRRGADDGAPSGLDEVTVSGRDGPERLDLALPDPFDARLEDEDDDLVVLANRRMPILSPPPRYDDDPTASQVGRAVAHLLGPARPKPPPMPAAADLEAEDLGGELLDLDAPTPAAVPVEPRPPKRRAAPTPWVWLGALALVLVIGGALAAALAGVVLLQG
jgi:hypothetical protein